MEDANLSQKPVQPEIPQLNVQIEVPRAPKPRLSTARRHPVISAGLALGLVAGAAGVYNSLDDGSGYEEHETARQVGQSVTKYTENLFTCVGTLATHSTNELDEEAGIHQSIPIIHKKPGFSFSAGTYPGQFPTEVDLCYKGFISTSRADQSTRPTPSDRVVVTVDPNSFFLNRPRVNALLRPEEFVVSGGKIVSRDGKPVEKSQQVRIFANDGTYSTGEYLNGGQDSALADGVEGLTLGHLDIGKNAHSHLESFGQFSARNPDCLQKVFDKVSPEQLTTGAFRDSYAQQGFNPDNVEVNFTSNKWPSAQDMKDESGFTYDDVLTEFKKQLPKKEKISSQSDCKTDNVNTLTPQTEIAGQADRK